MTQIARLFPHLPEPVSTPGAGPGSLPPVAPGKPPAGPAHQPQPSPAAFEAPPTPRPAGPSLADRSGLHRLARLISALETDPAIPERIRNMPGLAVLRQHFDMQCALEGLLRGLIKE